MNSGILTNTEFIHEESVTFSLLILQNLSGIYAQTHKNHLTGEASLALNHGYSPKNSVLSLISSCKGNTFGSDLLTFHRGGYLTHPAVK